MASRYKHKSNKLPLVNRTSQNEVQSKSLDSYSADTTDNGGSIPHLPGFDSSRNQQQSESSLQGWKNDAVNIDGRLLKLTRNSGISPTKSVKRPSIQKEMQQLFLSSSTSSTSTLSSNIGANNNTIRDILSTRGCTNSEEGVVTLNNEVEAMGLCLRKLDSLASLALEVTIGGNRHLQSSESTLNKVPPSLLYITERCLTLSELVKKMKESDLKNDSITSSGSATNVDENMLEKKCLEIKAEWKGKCEALDQKYKQLSGEWKVKADKLIDSNNEIKSENDGLRKELELMKLTEQKGREEHEMTRQQKQTVESEFEQFKKQQFSQSNNNNNNNNNEENELRKKIMLLESQLNEMHQEKSLLTESLESMINQGNSLLSSTHLQADKLMSEEKEAQERHIEALQQEIEVLKKEASAPSVVSMDDKVNQLKATIHQLEVDLKTEKEKVMNAFSNAISFKNLYESSQEQSEISLQKMETKFINEISELKIKLEDNDELISQLREEVLLEQLKLVEVGQELSSSQSVVNKLESEIDSYKGLYEASNKSCEAWMSALKECEAQKEQDIAEMKLSQSNMSVDKSQLEISMSCLVSFMLAAVNAFNRTIDASNKLNNNNKNHGSCESSSSSSKYDMQMQGRWLDTTLAVIGDLPKLADECLSEMSKCDHNQSASLRDLTSHLESFHSNLEAFTSEVKAQHLVAHQASLLSHMKGENGSNSSAVSINEKNNEHPQQSSSLSSFSSSSSDTNHRNHHQTSSSSSHLAMQASEAAEEALKLLRISHEASIRAMEEESEFIKAENVVHASMVQKLKLENEFEKRALEHEVSNLKSRLYDSEDKFEKMRSMKEEAEANCERNSYLVTSLQAKIRDLAGSDAKTFKYKYIYMKIYINTKI
jgi:hypothetical protein